MRFMLLLALFVAACSKQVSDLATISEARSLAAEWALINEEAAKGQLTPAYTATMHEQLREQLQSTASSLRSPHSRSADEIHSLLDEPDNAAPEELRSHVAVLKQIEDSLESA